MNLLRYILFCFFFAFMLQPSLPQVTEEAFDSLYLRVQEHPEDTTATNLFFEEVTSMIHEDHVQAQVLIQKLISFSRTKKYDYLLARSLLSLGISQDISGSYEEAFRSYREALAMAEQHAFISLEANIHNNYSITLAITGAFDESIESALMALEIYNQLNDSVGLAQIYNNLGARYHDLKQYDEALAYYQKAAVTNERLGKKEKLAYNYGNIGLVYFEIFESEKALQYFEKSFKLQDTLNDKYNTSIALHNLALAHMQMGRFNEALANERKAYALAAEINDDLGVISSLTGLAKIFQKKKQYNKALAYYKEAEQSAESIGARYYLVDIFQNISEIYTEKGDYKSGLDYNMRYIELKDSILTFEKDKAMQRIKVFENEKQKQEIQLLIKDSEINKLQLKRQKLIRNSAIALGSLLLLLAGGLFHRYRYVRRTRNELSEKNQLINKEKKRSDDLLLNILPAETAEELKEKGSSKARKFDNVSVMFTDFKGFTQMAEQLPPEVLVEELDYCFGQFDLIISKYGVEKIKTIGDAYMCASGLPVSTKDHAIKMVGAALEIQDFMVKLKKERQLQNQPCFEIRAGIHSGPVIAGIVGIKKFQYDIWGDTVNIAARMESSGATGKVNISSTTFELVKDYFECTHRGKIEAKNKGAIDMYYVKPKKSI